MSKKFIISASVIILLLGVVAVAIVSSDVFNSNEANQTNASPTGDRSSASNRPFAGNRSKNNPSPKTQREFRDKQLVEQYGEARTNLARQVSQNVVSLFDEVIEMGSMMQENETFARRGQWQLRRLTRNADIELNEAQSEQAKQLLAEFQKKELERTRKNVDQLRDDPSSLMAVMLASDAFSREEMSEEEYTAIQQANAEALGDVINPLDRSNYRGSDPLDDDEFRRSFEAMLEADQLAAFNEANTPGDDQQDTQTRSQTNITEMPVMALESLDEAIGSAQKMTAGMRQMMEGMGGLGPLLEQQRQNRADGN